MIIYGSKNCAYCTKAVELLQLKGIEYEYRDINATPMHKHFLQQEGFLAIPQIYDGGLHIGGYSDLVTLLDAVDRHG
jgi:glutaredoxin